MKRISLVLLFLLTTSLAFGSGSTLKQIDNIQNSTGGSSLSVPGTGSSLTTDSNTQTLSNKSISGASNTLTAIPASAISSGQLGVANGGTGAASLTLNNVILGNGTSSVQFVAPGTSGNVLTSNGTTWQSTAAASTAPNVVASFGSPTSITAVGGITFSGTNSINFNYIVGNGGPVTVTANPQISVGSVNGQALHLIGTSGTNTVILSDGTGLALNGPWTGGLSQVLNLEWDNGASIWRETSRSN